VKIKGKRKRRAELRATAKRWRRNDGGTMTILDSETKAAKRLRIMATNCGCGCGF